MATIEVVGGDLWEYDVDRTLSVTGFEEGDLLDVAREPACVAVTVPIADDGTAPVPNQLLGRHGGRLLVLIRRNNQVVYGTWLKVNGRKRPEDYGYVTTPTVGYQSLRQEMLDRFKELEDDVATAGLVKGVEAPLSLSEAGILSVDVGAASRGTQVTVGDEPPTTGVRPGDSFIRKSDMALLVAQEG